METTAEQALEGVQAALEEGVVSVEGLAVEADAQLETMKGTWEGAFSDLDATWADQFARPQRTRPPMPWPTKGHCSYPAAGETGRMGLARDDARYRAGLELVKKPPRKSRRRSSKVEEAILGLGYDQLILDWLAPLQEKVDTFRVDSTAALTTAAEDIGRKSDRSPGGQRKPPGR